MNEEKIKESFAKVKQDISLISSQLEILKKEFYELRFLMHNPLNYVPTSRGYADRDSEDEGGSIKGNLYISRQTNKQSDTPAHIPTQSPAEKSQNPALQHIISTQTSIPAHIPADNLPLKPLKTQNISISTGNEGVPTDRQQTDSQTDNSTGNQGVKVRLIEENPLNHNQKTLHEVSAVLNSIDLLKRELKQKFKKLTTQELVIFSTIYQLEEEGFVIDYPLISQRLSLTESSVRDYVQRLIKKEIPVIKTKENNKKIILAISPDLKKIATLSTILSLKESKIK